MKFKFLTCVLKLLLFNLILANLNEEEPEKVTMMDAINYLQKYGYVRHSTLVENASSTNIIEDTQTIIKRSIKKFQEIAGLPKTGDLDKRTKEMFAAPRCAVSDFQAQSAFDVKWQKNNLVYFIENNPPDLTKKEISEAIAKAFSKWSAVTPLNFKEVDKDGDDVDIRIGFFRKYHGDNDPFDGEGGALAHALWPPNGIVHFDNDEKWAYKDGKKIQIQKNGKYVYRDLLQTATHEIGHAIGMDHVYRNDSIMKTFYMVTTDSDGNYVEPELYKFDIERIQDRYGPRNPIVEEKKPEPKEKPFTRNGFYAIKRGDTGKKIAEAFDITEQDLKTMNPSLNLNRLNPGRWIRVFPSNKQESPKKQNNPCPSEWTYYEKAQKCLRISPNSGIFNDIDSYCKKNGATVISIHSQEENGFIDELIKKELSSDKEKRVWIGLADLDMDDAFTWSDDSDIDFFDWQPDQPANEDGNQRNVVFGSLTKGKDDPSEIGHWDDVDGERSQFKGICQKKAQTSSLLSTTKKPTTTNRNILQTSTKPTSSCPDKWVSFENYCYHVGQNPKTWFEAEQNCRKEEAHLASIHSEAENEFLIGISALGSTVYDTEAKDHVWIGLSDLLNEGKFAWIDGSPTDYLNWASPTQPDNDGTGVEDCVQLWADEQTNIGVVYKKWNDNDCNRKMRAYICKKEVKSWQTLSPKQITELINKANACPERWIYVEAINKCYYFGGTDKFISWADAQSICSGLGSNLASVHSKEENKAIESILKTKRYSSWAWLGGVKYENKWMWIDGSTWDYDHWFRSEPNGDGPCLHMWPAEEGSWNDMGCDNMDWNRQYVCSKPAKNTKPCPDDWFPFNRFCYQAVTNKPATWFEAEFNCNSKGGHLTSIHSEEENEFIIGLTSTGKQVGHDTDNVWIGMTDVRKEGDYVWSDGTHGFYYNWSPNQPDNYQENEDCILLLADKQENKNLIFKKWSDTDCTTNMRAYVCKKSAHK